MKKTITVLITFALLLACPLSAFAAADEYVYDHNGNLSASQVAQLNERAAEVYLQYGFDVLIDMDDSVSENAVSYAERRYTEMDGAENGILLVITETNWYIHLEGEAANIMSDFHLDFMWESYDVEATYFDGVACYIIAANVILDEQYSEAPSAAADTPEIPAERQKARLVDEAGLLTATEQQVLLKQLDEISERQACDVAVVTVNSLEGKTAEAFADDYYDYNGYGMGAGDDGILLLISIEDRDWAITTYGFGIPAFTDAGQEYIVGKFKSDLSAGNYAAAFTTFAGLCDDFLQEAHTGEPYDRGHLPDSVGFWRGYFNLFIFVLPLGFLIAMVVTHFMKKKLKSVEMQKAANSYVRPGSKHITASRDSFLYRNVSKVAKATESSGGGSSTHTSSSGRSHGGSSGKF